VVGIQKIIWDIEARNAFKAACQYIKRDSLENAEKVKREVIEATLALKSNPEMHPPDKYRRNKDKRYRAFELNSFRLSYFIIGDAVRIVRFRHVKQAPKEY
jgi:plasmid stabilization system protein ParE